MKRIGVLIGILLMLGISVFSQTQTTSTHMRWKNGISTDSIGGYSGDSMIIDGEGLLKFRDDLAGEHTLSEIVAGGTLNWQRLAPIVSLANSGDDVRLTVGTEQLQFGDASNYIYSPTLNNWSLVQAGSNTLTLGTNLNIFKNILPGTTSTYNIGDGTNFFNAGYFDRVYLENVNTYLDISGTDMTFTSADAGTLNLSDIGDGLNTWGSATQIPYMNGGGTNFSYHSGFTYNPGVSLNVDATSIVTSYHVSTTAAPKWMLKSVDGNHGIRYDPTISNQISIWSNGANAFQVTSTAAATSGTLTVGSTLLPDVDRTNNIGSTSFFWDNTYVDRLYIDNVNTYLDIDGSNNMTFTDAVTGTKTLAELATGIIPDSSWTSITVDTIYAPDAILSVDDNMAPTSDDSYDLGQSTLRWDGIYGTTYWIDGSTYMFADGSSNLSFVDAVTGTKTLADLAASGGVVDSSWISIEVDTIKGNTLNSEHTIIFDKDGEDNSILWMGFDDVSTEASYLYFVDDGSRLYGRDYTNGRITDMQLSSDWFTVQHNSSSGTNYIRMDSTIFQIQDGHDGSGIEYAADYSANFTDSTLVDKRYVDGNIPIYSTISTETGSTYTLDINDAQTLIISDRAGGTTITVPPNSSVAFPIGTRIRISKIGTSGNCNINEGTGVTINNWNSAPAVRSMGTGELIKIDTDEWMLTGDIVQDA